MNNIKMMILSWVLIGNLSGSGLLCAAETGQVEVVKGLLKIKELNLEISNKNRRTALMLAAHNGHVDIVNLLIPRGADLDNQDKDESTALMLALSNVGTALHHNCLCIVKILIGEGADLDKQNKDGDTALMLASKGAVQATSDQAYNDYLRAINALIGEENHNRRADLDKQNKDGTALMIFVKGGDGYGAGILLGRGASCNVRVSDPFGDTALIMALRKSDTTTASLLIRSKADIHCRYVNDETALMIASEKGCLDNVRELVDHRANCNERGNHKRTALMYALCQRQLVRGIVDILAPKTSPNLRDSLDYTDLMYAAEKGHNIIRVLINAGADVNFPNNFDETALMRVACFGHKVVAVSLIQNGARVNLGNKVGRTALMYASLHGHRDMVETLVQRGAEVNLSSAITGDSAIELAHAKGHEEIVEFLLENGAIL
ncbi:MAG: ankyrin repeat domain-containing protein [Alphaproteobacteria bacterium]|nr:MAG: ankyrin repeat domain-containing protein [Alphaproteobacteria bacterium]